MKKGSILFLLPLLLLPLFAFAQAPVGGLVPDWCQAGCPCSFCDLYDLASNILGFLLYIVAVPIAAGAFLYGGVLMLTSGGNPTQISKGKSMITSAITGMALAFFAWAILNTILTTIGFGIGNAGSAWYQTLKCERGGGSKCNIALGDEIVPEPPGEEYNEPLVPPWPGPASCNRSANQIASDRAKLAPYENDIRAAAARYGVSEARIRAIIMTESSGQFGVTSRAGAVGLMQILPGTARLFDSGATPDKLRNPSYNIDMGTRIYADLLQDYGNPDFASAGYNGGGDRRVGANGPSADCPGIKRWQCPWDSPGCYQTERTDCRRNTGYAETRKYVDRVNSFEKCFSG